MESLSTTSTPSLDDLFDLMQPDARVLADGRRRMADLWNNRPSDSLPIIFGAPVPEGVAGCGDFRRHVEDPEQMLYDLVAGLVGLALSGSDGQLAIRVDTGPGTLATLAGCPLTTSEYSLPWTAHLSREVLEAFDPQTADLSALGLMPRIKELYAAFRARLPETIHCYCVDTQGPFDLAHLLYGNELFYAVYDDPEFAHQLLEKSTALYIRATAQVKEWIDEPRNGGYHVLYALDNCGVRACEDTSTLLSPGTIDEYVIPYQRQALEAFGGGYVHYCGDNDALYAAILRNPAVRGLNFGNPERHDFSRVIPQLIEAGKCYLGILPREEDETLEAYFRRVIGYTGGTRKGLIFTPRLTAEEVTDPRRVIDLWRSLQ
ncbi:MAG TPA: hypothetical protein VGM23_18545 [Armatimonadota bacterium]|jgi:hypothetical protein